MMSVTKDINAKKHKKSKKKSHNKISFDEEIVPKGTVQTLKPDSKTNVDNSSMETEIQIDNSSLETEPPAEPQDTKQTKGKRKKNKKPKAVPQSETKSEAADQAETEGTDVLDPKNPKIDKTESIRAKKRKKYEQLLLTNKLKSDLAMQEKCLNYLSQWKHNRSDWKFEKLRQVWVQQNMFDCDRVPDRFWETVVEYFSNAKGKIRKTIIDDALKLIEQGEAATSQTMDAAEEETESGNEDDVKSSKIKLLRAKSIIQSLQE